MNFIMKSLLKKKLGGHVPDEQLDVLLAAIEKNPNFFKQVAEEIQQKVSAGMSQEAAAMEVMKTRQVELAEMLKK